MQYLFFLLTFKFLFFSFQNIISTIWSKVPVGNQLTQGPVLGMKNVPKYQETRKNVQPVLTSLGGVESGIVSGNILPVVRTESEPVRASSSDLQSYLKDLLKVGSNNRNPFTVGSKIPESIPVSVPVSVPVLISGGKDLFQIFITFY